MANSAFKINQFCKANNVTSGVIYHSGMRRNLLVKTHDIKEVLNLGAIHIAEQVVNSTEPVLTHIKNNDMRTLAAIVLKANGVQFEQVNLSPRGGKKGNALKLVSLPEVIKY
jgi:hypothetical protein